MDMNKWVGDGETIEDLQREGLRIIQKRRGFRFGIDSVLLSGFVVPRKKDRVLDLGMGTGIIPLLLSTKITEGSISAIEILPEMVEMASRSVKLNGLENLINVVCGDLKECAAYFKKGSFDVVTANPPYMNAGGGLVNLHDAKAIARHEIMCTLEDVVKAAAQMLRHQGSFYMVHKPGRLADIICVMRKHKLEVKNLRFVHSREGEKPSMVLIKGMKGSNPLLEVMAPLFVYRDGAYSDEVMGIYGYPVRNEV